MSAIIALMLAGCVESTALKPDSPRNGDVSATDTIEHHDNLVKGSSWNGDPSSLRLHQEWQRSWEKADHWLLESHEKTDSSKRAALPPQQKVVDRKIPKTAQNGNQPVNCDPRKNNCSSPSNKARTPVSSSVEKSSEQQKLPVDISTDTANRAKPPIPPSRKEPPVMVAQVDPSILKRSSGNPFEKTPSFCAVGEQYPQDHPDLPPQNEQEWYYREIKKILLEFGEHKDFQVPPFFQQQVEIWIKRFTKRPSQANDWFVSSLRRMDKYQPMIANIFSEKHLPSSLYYLALVESGFSPQARSHAGAVGLWQFIPGTARRYGLRIDSATDQRVEPQLITVAAREYLLDLILEFGEGHSVLLAMAAYNAGENRIRQQLRRLENYRERGFWTIAEKGFLPEETHDYVPKILAAAIIGRNRDHFGLGEI